GAVLGSPVGDLGSTFRRLNGSFFAGLPAMVVAALGDAYPELDRVIKRHATAQGRALLDSLKKMTTVEAVLRMMFKNMSSYVSRPLDEILDGPEVQFVFDDIKLGKQTPAPPVLIVQAVHDKIVSVDDIDELTENYRAGGASVTYHRDMFSEHMLLHPMSAPMTLRWLRDRFAGRRLSEHLVRTEWPTLFNPSTYKGMVKLVTIAGRVITGRKLHRRPLSVADAS
ncbi:MAG: lipase, partial [Mycobacteriaceae bacterium]|nr:lipase [Mycobacteriaceae bacterium]